MLMVYIALMVCTALPVFALQAGMGMEFLVWLVFVMIIIKAVLLVDHFMEMRNAPSAWRLTAQIWAPAIITVVAAFEAIT